MGDDNALNRVLSGRYWSICYIHSAAKMDIMVQRLPAVGYYNDVYLVQFCTIIMYSYMYLLYFLHAYGRNLDWT